MEETPEGLAVAGATREAAKRKRKSETGTSEAKRSARPIPVISHEVAVPKDYDETARNLDPHLHGTLENPRWNGPRAKEYPFVLDPFQEVSVACIERRESVLVSAHTSAGKTAVAEYAIALAFNNNQRVVYTSPLKGTLGLLEASTDHIVEDFTIHIAEDIRIKHGIKPGAISRSTDHRRESLDRLSYKKWAIVLLVLTVHSVSLQPLTVHAAGSNTEGAAASNGSGRSLQTLNGPLGLLGNIANRIVEDIQTKKGLKPVVPTTTPLLPTSSAVPLVTTRQPVSTTPLLASTVPSTTLIVPTSTPGVTSTPSATSNLIPTTSVMPSTSLTPTTSMAPTSTPTVTSTAPLATSSAPPTSTSTPLSCADAVSLTFSGANGDSVGTQGPFSFPGWTYDFAQDSTPPTYQQSILNQASSTQVINVTDASGILLCNIAASGTNADTNATFQGITLGGQTVTMTQALPAWTDYANATFDNTWQPLSAIEIITPDNPTFFSTELWEISYVLP